MYGLGFQIARKPINLVPYNYTAINPFKWFLLTYDAYTYNKNNENIL